MDLTRQYGIGYAWSASPTVSGSPTHATRVTVSAGQIGLLGTMRNDSFPNDNEGPPAERSFLY